MTKSVFAIFSIFLFALPSAATQMGIEPGRGIGPALVGMPAGAARAVLSNFGGRLLQTTEGTWQVISAPSQGISAWIRSGIVRQVRTVNPNHQTITGLAPGRPFDEIARESFCNKDGIRAAVEFERGERSHIGCPFAGLIVEVSGGRVFAVSVIAACAPFDKERACPWRTDAPAEGAAP